MYNSFNAKGFSFRSKDYLIDSPDGDYSNLHLSLPPIAQERRSITPSKSEITILCIRCEEEIKVRNLKEHREFHNALALFRFSMENKPTNVKQLVKRRRAILKRLNESAYSEDPVPVRKLQKLNLAYELLKADVEGTSSSLRSVGEYFNPDVKGQGTAMSCALAFGICQDANSRWKTSMEDRFAFKDCFCNDPQSGFFSIYDGYCGSMAAEKCARYLGGMLEDKIEKIYRTSIKHENVNYEIVTAFNETFEDIDNILLLGIAEQSRNRWSGCSALTCLLRGNNLYVANAGDIRAVLCRGDGSMECLSHNQSPWDKKERHRVRKAKGEVTKSEKTALVNGLVKSTRGLGNHGDPNLKASVIRKPAVNCVTLEENDQFLILASSGVWDVFSEEEVILLLEDLIPDLDVKAVVKRMHDRASALEGGLPLPKWGDIPLRDKGVEVSRHSSPEETLPERVSCNNQNSEYKPNGETSSEVKASKKSSKEQGLLPRSKRLSGHSSKDTSMPLVESSDYGDNEVNDTTNETSRRDTTLLAHSVSNILPRGSMVFRKEKACALAKALSERLVEGALLAGSRENITVSVVLLNGCPLQMFLLPSI